MTSWAIAVAMAGVFSVVVGMTVAGKLNQISADKTGSTSTTTQKVSAPYYTSNGKQGGDSIDERCNRGTLVAINNYPDLNTLKEIPAENDKGINRTWLDKMGEQSWKCSHVCITGFNEGDYRSEGNKEKVKQALEGATAKINDQKDTKIQVLDSDEILELMKNDPKGMKSVVNIDSLKSHCEGPNSTDYSAVNTTLGETTILKRNETNTVNISSSSSGTSSPAGIGNANSVDTSGLTGTAPNGTTSSDNDDNLGESGASAGGTPQLAKPEGIGYDKDKPSDVAKCWLAVANESAKHMKEHLRVYNQTNALQIINDINNLLLGYKRGQTQYPALHGGTNENKPKIAAVYNKYSKIVKTDDKDKTKYKKNEATLLKECNQILERIPKFSTDRTDITELKEKKEKLTDTYEKIVKSELNLTNRIGNPNGAYGYAGTDIKGFFDFIKAIGAKRSLLDKERYQDIKGYENVINDIKATDNLQNQLNQILVQNPIVTGESAKSTIKVIGNIAINNSNIKNGLINNGGKTIHVCVYIIGKEKNDCYKIKTNKSNGYFEVILNDVGTEVIKDFSGSYDTNKIKIYAVTNPGKFAFIRNILTSFPSQTSDGRVSFGPSGRTNQYNLKITTPITLLGDFSANLLNKPTYPFGKNGVKEALNKFMKDTRKGNCLLLPSNTMTN